MRSVILGILLVGFTAGAARDARAQGFISPFVGYDFGGDAQCPHLTNCEDKRLNAGVAFGKLGDVFGFEEEIAYARDFFGTAPGLSSSVLSAMSNLMIVPAIGPVHPYAVGGIGLIKTHVEFAPTSIFTSDNNNLGWDLGGGVMIFFNPHVGVRGDIRYFHSFQDLKALGFTLSDTKLDFGRTSAGLVLKF